MPTPRIHRKAPSKVIKRAAPLKVKKRLRKARGSHA